MIKIAILITVHNRIEKTIKCLNSIYNQDIDSSTNFSIYLVDDGSEDNTSDIIKEKYPDIHIIKGDGTLFWNGGMRLAWENALTGSFDNFLLINNDTVLYNDCIGKLINSLVLLKKSENKSGIIVGTVVEPENKIISYGGYRLLNNFSPKVQICKPKDSLVNVDVANANILLVPFNVIKKIGILKKEYTHSIGDFDYTLTAKENNIPVVLCPNYCGECSNDHSKPWLSNDSNLKQRISYLKSPKYLAYNEYMHYIKMHFRFYVPIAFLKLWLKIFFPFIWIYFKKEKE